MIKVEHITTIKEIDHGSFHELISRHISVVEILHNHRLHQFEVPKWLHDILLPLPSQLSGVSHPLPDAMTNVLALGVSSNQGD